MKRYDMQSQYNYTACEDQVQAAECKNGEWVRFSDAIKAISDAYDAGAHDGYEACADGAMIDIDVYAKYGAEEYAENVRVVGR